MKDHHQETHVTLQSRGQKKCYISTSTRPIATKLDKEVASDERMLFAKPHNLFITCIYQVTWPVATKLDNMVPLDKGKFYIQHAKCTRSLSFDFTDLVKIHYVFKTKRLAKKIPPIIFSFIWSGNGIQITFFSLTWNSL